MKIQRNTWKTRSGFTLAESVIALGILVVLITGFLAVFGPAATAIRRTLSAEEGSRLQGALENELVTLRQGEEASRYKTSFEKAFEWIRGSHQRNGIILLYNYRANPAFTRADGSLEPEEDVNGISGEDYLIQPMVRRIDDPFVEDDFQAIEGRVFFVKLTQLVFEGEALKVADSVGSVVDPHDPSSDFTTDSEGFPEAVVFVEAQFFTLPTRAFSYLSGAFDPTQFTRPVFRRNIGIPR